ncbi:MAG TPA: DUF2207 domain-containing protein, partial [Candidatus Saccharimonadales bacterium]|nr:DUF2207 domain-containing protein [Candidatus Saccharimonadales bacterium]
GLAFAQSVQPATQIKFISFNGVYHLSRDSRGVSLLTSQETIGADFQDSGDYGITRSLPKKFNGQAVDVKVLNVTDAAGNPVPYKTASDNKDNLVITTGDPKINLYGPQTIKINYQTTGVINLNQKSDQFLLNVNGRGWSQPFDGVSATLYVPDSFQAAILGQPSCYVSPGNGQCRVDRQEKPGSTVITTEANNVKAGQALVLRVNFKPSTFTQKKSSPNPVVYVVVALLLIAIMLVARSRRRKTR